MEVALRACRGGRVTRPAPPYGGRTVLTRHRVETMTGRRDVTGAAVPVPPCHHGDEVDSVPSPAAARANSWLRPPLPPPVTWTVVSPLETIHSGRDRPAVLVIYVPDEDGTLYVIHAMPLTDRQKKRLRRRLK